MAARRITVIGIRPPPGSIGPGGHHLRWMFPPAKGFPPKGFRVYRRPSADFKPEDCLDLSDVSTTLPSGGQLDGVHFYYPGATPIQRSGNALSVTPVVNGLLELRFPRPMVYVHLEVAGVDAPLTLRAYAGGELMASSMLPGPAGGTRRIEIVASFITRVTISLRFRVLHAVCFLSAEAACALEDWTDPRGAAPVDLPLVESAPQALARLESGLANRYARDRTTAARRYERELPALIEALHQLQDPSDSVFANPGAGPDRLQLASASESPLRGLALQSVLLLAALDPNVARFLSLYWVDAEDSPGGPVPGTRYDYKIVGAWEDGELCGLLLGLGGSLAHRPVVDEDVGAKQLAGLRWRSREPLGRVGVSWPRPKTQPVTGPVLFDVWRLTGASGPGAPALLTRKSLVLVDGRAWSRPDATRFVDGGVPLGTYRYRLAGIDIFGQVSEPVDSTAVTVRDLEAPPPPVRLRTGPIPATPPAALDVQFEFGEAQDRQAPDVAGFKLYWRSDTRVVRRRVHAEAVSRDGRPDGPGVYTVRIVSDPPVALRDFIGGVLNNVAADGTLPAADRRRYGIAGLVAVGLVRLAPTRETFVDGDYNLVSDPQAVAGWTELAPEIKARRPHVGRVLAVEDFRARAAHVRLLQPPVDVLGVLPAERRPDLTVSAAPVVEVLLDRALLEPGLFAGGIAHVDGAHHPILYTTAGQAFASGGDTAARVGLPATAIIVVGAELRLSPPPAVRGVISEARAQSRGGLAVVIPRIGHPAGPAHLVGAPATAGERRYTVVQAAETSGGLALELRPRDAASADPDALVGAELVVVPHRALSLRIEGTPPSGPQTAAGGEAAFESAGDVPHVARVVSHATAGTGHFDVLLRLSPGAEDALRPGITRIRSFAPYRLSVRVDPSAGAGQPAAIPLGVLPGEARRSLYLAASAYDARGNATGAPVLSAPVDVTLVRAAPSGRPGPPFPCDLTADAEAGYATPPDRRGRATVCVQWDRGNVEPAEGLRYELARTTDVAILAAHRRNWLLGRAPVEDPLGAGPRREGTLSAVTFDAARGHYRASLAVGPGDASAAAFAGGRLVQPPLDPATPGATRAYFQVTRADGPVSGLLVLLLQPMGRTAPAAGPCTLEGPPDAQAARDDVGALRRLAEQNLDAFGVVTGVPVTPTRFTDEVPGVGRNRFFYRVRAVDGAENRSAWSDVSRPFHQVDTTPPAPPRLIQALAGERQAILRWESDPAGQVTEYRVYRAPDASTLDHLPGQTPVATVPVDPAAPPALSVTFVDAPVPGLAPGHAYTYRVEAIKRVPRSANTADDLLIRAASESRAVAVFDNRIPEPPEWVAAHWNAARTGIVLAWTPGSDGEHLVQRLTPPRAGWSSVTDWMPATTAAFTDGTADLAREQLYRIRVRDARGALNDRFAVRRVPPPGD